MGHKIFISYFLPMTYYDRWRTDCAGSRSNGGTSGGCSIVSAAVGSGICRSTRRRRGAHHDDHDGLGREPGGDPGAGASRPSRSSHGDRLANGSGCGQAIRGRGHCNLELPLHAVQVDSAGRRTPLGIGYNGEAMGAIGKGSPRAAFGQQKDYRGVRHGLMILVLYLNDRLARGALADVIDGAVTPDGRSEERRVGKEW